MESNKTSLSRKKILQDPSFWVLIGVNGYLVYHYYLHPEIFVTLIFLYWSQSMLLGIFTVLDLLTVTNAVPTTYKINDVLTTIRDDKRSRWGSVKFFVIVYGFLHMLYLLFLVSMTKDKEHIQWSFFKYFFFLFLAGQILNFIQHKIQQRRQATDTGPMIASPFIRVLPMHLTIVLASFFTSSAIGIFLILKSLADIFMYAATKPRYKTKESDAALLVAEQNINANL